MFIFLCREVPDAVCMSKKETGYALSSYPHSALEISQLGLGTMTFGEQNSEADAHAQLDYAVSGALT